MRIDLEVNTTKSGVTHVASLSRSPEGKTGKTGKSIYVNMLELSSGKLIPAFRIDHRTGKVLVSDGWKKVIKSLEMFKTTRLI
ncbi:MAG: hypothetical protein ABID54_03050 [Pseudomonadota bacterium]